MVENVLQKYNILFKPSADIPAYAVMESTGSETVNHEICVDTRKYVAGSPKKVLLVNGPIAVDSGTYGRCAMAADRPLQVLGSGSAGQIVGPSDGSTSLSSGHPGFVCIGAGAVSGTVVAQRQLEHTRIIGSATANVATTNTTFTIDNVTAFSGLEPVQGSSNTITVQNTFELKVNDNAKVAADYNESADQWVAIGGTTNSAMSSQVVVTGHTINTTSNTFDIKTRTLRGDWTNNESGWVTYHTGNTC